MNDTSATVYALYTRLYSQSSFQHFPEEEKILQKNLPVIQCPVSDDICRTNCENFWPVNDHAVTGTLIFRALHNMFLRRMILKHSMQPQNRYSTRSPTSSFFCPTFFTAAMHFASKRFWFYEFLFVQIWAVTKHSDSSSTIQSEQRTVFLRKNDINIFSIT